MSPEALEYLKRGLKKRDKGRISELISRDVLEDMLPDIVAKVEPQVVGAFYDQDIFLRDEIQPSKVKINPKLEVKSSKKGVSDFGKKVMKEFPEVKEDEIDRWLLQNFYITLIVGFERDGIAIASDFCRKLGDLFTYHGQRVPEPVLIYQNPKAYDR